MKNTLSIGEAAAMLGCSITTLRRWHKSDKLIPQFHTFWWLSCNVIDASKMIYSETRLFIVGGKIVTYSEYKRGERVMDNAHVDDHILEFGQKIAASHSICFGCL
jgi:hypothetical protein